MTYGELQVPSGACTLAVPPNAVIRKFGLLVQPASQLRSTAGMDAIPPAIAIRPVLTHLGHAVCICLCATAVHAGEVVVYTDRHHPVVATAGTRIVELDAAERVTAELAADLPPDPSQAAQAVRQRLQEGSGVLQLRMASAANDVVEAWQLGVQKIPAVVVDRRYVVYGEADVARALEAVTRYREAGR